MKICSNGDSLESLGDLVEIHPRTHLAKIGGLNELGFMQINGYLRDNDLIDGGYTFKYTAGRDDHISVYQGDIALTLNGWEQYQRLKQGISSTNIAFMAMQFNDKLLDEIYFDHFKPTVEETGFEMRRLDEKPEPGLIDNRLKAEILKSKFMIADLSLGNNGAYWEAGFAEGLGKPVIYTCEQSHFEKHKTHFDTNHYFTIVWDKGNISEAMELLKATIQMTFRSH